MTLMGEARAACGAGGGEGRAGWGAGGQMPPEVFLIQSQIHDVRSHMHACTSCVLG